MPSRLISFAEYTAGSKASCSSDIAVQVNLQEVKRPSYFLVLPRTLYDHSCGRIAGRSFAEKLLSADVLLFHMINQEHKSGAAHATLDHPSPTRHLPRKLLH